METLEYPDWYFDDRRTAYWYYHKPTNAYYLYTQRHVPNTPTEDETAYPMWHYDQGRSVFWYFCEETMAYHIHGGFVQQMNPAPEGKVDNCTLHSLQNDFPQADCATFCLEEFEPEETEVTHYCGTSYEHLQFDKDSHDDTESSTAFGTLSVSTGKHVGLPPTKRPDIYSTTPEECQEKPADTYWEFDDSTADYSSMDCTVGVEFQCTMGSDTDNKFEASDDYHTEFTLGEGPYSQGARADCSQLIDFDGKDLANTACAERGQVLDEEEQRQIDLWQAQYGQVLRTETEVQCSSGAISLWNWRTEALKPKGRGTKAMCLVGQLAADSSRLHPSLQHHNGLIRTSSVQEVYLDLVKVLTGELFRLRQPSSRYLAAVATYDAANPTKNWGYPSICLSVSGPLEGQPKDVSGNVGLFKDLHGSAIAKPLVPKQGHNKSACDRKRKQRYRDRAQERRNLYGGYGVGLGQKLGSEIESCTTSDSGKKQAEDGSAFAKRMLEKMGWQEGESLGRKKDGIVEPIIATQNRNRAGIGWATSSTD